MLTKKKSQKLVPFYTCLCKGIIQRTLFVLCFVFVLAFVKALHRGHKCYFSLLFCVPHCLCTGTTTERTFLRMRTGRVGITWANAATAESSRNWGFPDTDAHPSVPWYVFARALLNRQCPSMFAMALLNRQCPSMFASMFARLKSLYFGTLMSALLSLVSLGFRV